MLIFLLLSCCCTSVDVTEKSMNVDIDKTFLCFVKTNDKKELFQFSTLVIPTSKRQLINGNVQSYSNLDEAFLVRSEIGLVTAGSKDKLIKYFSSKPMQIYYLYFAGFTLDITKYPPSYTQENKPLILHKVGTYIIKDESEPTCVKGKTVYIGNNKFFLEYGTNSLFVETASTIYKKYWGEKNEKFSKCLNMTNLIFNVVNNKGDLVVLGKYMNVVDNLKIIKNDSHLKPGFIDFLSLYSQFNELVHTTHISNGETDAFNSNEISKDDKKVQNTKTTTRENEVKEGNEVIQGNEVKAGNRLCRVKLVLIIIVILFFVIFIVLLCIYIYKNKKNMNKYNTEC